MKEFSLKTSTAKLHTSLLQHAELLQKRRFQTKREGFR